MKMKKLISLMLGLGLFFSLPVYAADEGLLGGGAKLNYWFSELSGDVKVTEAVIGDLVDFKNDLGIDETDDVPGVEVWLRLGKNKLSLSYVKFEHEGSNSKNATINYKGVEYDLTATLNSKLDTTIADLLYERTLITAVNDSRLSLILGAKYLKFEAELTGQEVVTGTTITRSESIDAPVPVVGLAGSMNLTERINIGVKLYGISLDVSNTKATMINFLTEINYNITENAAITAGYKYFDIDGTSDDDEANFNLKGLFLGVKAEF
jgi:hypothetical protein